MQDVLYLALAFAFFALTGWLVRLLARLGEEGRP